jgi:transcriptional regulator with XRE-family HTH domain
VDKNTIYLNAEGSYIDLFQKRLEQMNMTRYKLSELTGISQGTLSGYWSKEREPTLTNLLKITDALGIKVPLIIF